MKQYKIVTDRIIAMLEQGTRPWSQSWNAYAGGGRPLRHDGTPYRGANTINLWAAGMTRSFSSPYWMTFNRAKEIGGGVRKGARSECAFYVGSMSRTVERNGKEEDATIPFLKSYCVFNADEIDGLAPHYYAPRVQAVLPPDARIAEADAFIAATGAMIQHGGGRAYYHRVSDSIQLPDFGAFLDAPAYYGTAFHELVHWTGSPSRLERTKGKLFADPDYAFEELVAELGAAYLSADLAISTDPREDHASYMAAWLKALREDNRAIFRAASLAEKACGLLHKAQDAEDVQEAMAA